MSDCLFCKIVAGDIPAVKVYEDGELLAFLDVRPVNNGHTLLIPKEHHVNLAETPSDLAGSMMKMVAPIAKAVIKAVDAPAFNLGVNNGEEAGQVIHHTHFHIIPRFKDDGYESWHGRVDLDVEQGKVLADKIKAEILS